MGRHFLIFLQRGYNWAFIPEYMEVYFQLIRDAEGVRKACGELAGEKFIGFDTETTELDPYRGDIRLVQLSNGRATQVIDFVTIRTWRRCAICWRTRRR